VERFQRGGLTFDVRDSGPAGGEPVVLLHGFPQGPECYDGVLPALHAAGRRTLAPALRGYSPGARPARRRDYRLSECTDDVLALLDAAGIGAADVVGHDWGGAVAWQLAARHPDRVRSLVALSMPHPRAMTAAMPRGQFLRSWYMWPLQLPVLPERALPRALRRGLTRTGLPEASLDRYLARLAEPGAATAALNWYRALPWTLSTAVGPVSVPTTYAWGRDDPFLGPAAAKLTERHARGPYRFEVLDAGHWLPETRPHEVAALIVAAREPGGA
jgi:pimeloyl-ACP methyl ester carboxylesterase